MKRLSSKMTFFYKRVFPTLWFGFLAILVLSSLFAGPKGDVISLLPFMIIPIFMAVFGYVIMKKLFLDFFDEVWDEGSSLLFKNGGKELRINLRDIKNVSYSLIINPYRVALSLRHQTEFGKELGFSPTSTWIPFKKNPDIEELIDRIDRARG